METLILNGSPRKNGDTQSLIRLVTDSISGECKVVDAYSCDISPCIDCRCCRSHSGCAIHDGMDEVYDYIQHCDNILIASPIYFSELTGRLLDIASRFQTYFCARFFRSEQPIAKVKKGAVILVGGGDGSMNKAYDTAVTILRHANCRSIHPLVSSHGTNTIPAIEDKETLAGIDSIIDFFGSADT